MKTTHTILIVDDDVDILEALKIYLSKDEYQLLTARNGKDAVDIVKTEDVDLVLMDIMMPIMDGIKATGEIRKLTNIPIILLTAKSEDQDKVNGLDIGADDYITKPFSIPELVARVQMHIRREVRNNNSSEILQFGPLAIDKTKEELRIADIHIPTTKREFQLILLLSSNPNRIFSNEELFDYLYPHDSETQGRSITEYVYQIRQKLKPYEINPIKTIWGGGYQWITL